LHYFKIFSGKIMLFSSLFSDAHAFSEVILDCRTKNVSTKLLAMLIANFY
jgi:hypothetical protein